MALNFFKQRDIDEMDVNDIPEEFINYLETLDEAGKIGLLASRPDIAKVLGVSVEDSNQDTVNTTDDSSEIVQEDERNPKSSAVFEEEQDIRNSVNVEPDVDEPEEVNEEFIAIQNNYYEGKRLAEILKDNMEPLEALAIPDKTDKCFIHRVPFKEKQIRYTGKGATYGVSIIRLLMKSVCKMRWKRIYFVLFTILELRIWKLSVTVENHQKKRWKTSVI